LRKVEFIIDDYALAKRFVTSLPEKTQRSRFSDVKKWDPERVVLVKVDNRLAAMADAVVTADDAAASISLVARPSFEAYALRAHARAEEATQWKNVILYFKRTDTLNNSDFTSFF
jgi:hypothetical protein